VNLDRKAAVRRRDERAPANADGFRHHLPLAGAFADVLDHGVREDDVELAVGERERACVTLDVPDAVARWKPLPSCSPSAVILSGQG
jgi:hypothetical protein